MVRARHLGTALLVLVCVAPVQGVRCDEKSRWLSPQRAAEEITKAFTDLVRARVLGIGRTPELPMVESFDDTFEVKSLVAAGPSAIPVLEWLFRAKVPSERDAFRIKQEFKRRAPPLPPLHLGEEGALVSDLLHAVAARILGRLGEKAASTVPLLLKGLPKIEIDRSYMEYSRAWFSILEALRAIGPAAEAAVPRLRKLLAEENKVRPGPKRGTLANYYAWRYSIAGHAQNRLIHALANMGRKHLQAAVPEIADTLICGEEPAQVLAASALIALHGGADEELGARLKSKAAKVRVAARKAVPLYAKGAIDWLRKYLDRDTAWVLAALSRFADPAFETIAEELKSGYREYAYRALLAESLGSTRKKAGSATRVLRDLLRDRNAVVRAGALRGVARLGKRAKKAVPVLIGLLAGKEASDRRLAAAALGAIGPGASEAVPALRACGKDPDEGVRAAVKAALARIGGT